MPDDLDNLTDEQLRERVRVLEAQGGQGSSNPFEAPGPRRQEEREYSSRAEWRQDFERRFNQGTRGPLRYGGGTAQFTAQEAQSYLNELGAARLASALARNGAKPATREAFAKMRPETW
jgi:hypothetical protein